MGVLQASSLNVRPSPTTRRVFVKVRREKLRKIDTGESKQPESNVTIVASNIRDLAMVQQAIAGNTEAQENLFARHTSKLYRTAFALLRNKQDAEDAVQDALCKAFTRLSGLQGRSSSMT